MIELKRMPSGVEIKQQDMEMSIVYARDNGVTTFNDLDFRKPEPGIAFNFYSDKKKKFLIKIAKDELAYQIFSNMFDKLYELTGTEIMLYDDYSIGLLNDIYRAADTRPNDCLKMVKDAEGIKIGYLTRDAQAGYEDDETEKECQLATLMVYRNRSKNGNKVYSILEETLEDMVFLAMKNDLEQRVKNYKID